MKYRHGYHAGNFADVHKHVALLALLRALQLKDKGFLYLDTHAGAGSYDLAAAATHHGAEARHGVLALLAGAAPLAPELADYRNAVLAWRERCGAALAYPGSPALAALRLRPQDRGVCCELLPAQCRALERALDGTQRLRVECSDGYRAVAANLPPQERRALVLIDPPYESPAEEIHQALAAIGEILGRLAHAVVALWYPIKDERWLTAWQRQAAHALATPAVTLELWLYPRDTRVALNGSGLLLVNPPYRFAQRAAHWQQELLALLEAHDGAATARPGTAAAVASHPGGSAVRVLVAEEHAGHARA